jgi:GAF domain-containing protein
MQTPTADDDDAADRRRSETDGLSVGTTFAQAARLELDSLLEQLASRAQEVQQTQGRLRGLLHAFLQAGRADTLDGVLHHVVEAAGRLVDARYAALGVIRHGRLVQFLHTGMTPEQVDRIGQLPQGKGLLGVLIEQPRALRLPDMAGHPASAGFPDGHPPMRNLLGVPILDSDHVLGTLYLADKCDGGEFTADDQELVSALATVAAAAIKQATLLHDSTRHAVWQRAMIDVSTRLLAGAGTDTDTVLQQLVEHGRTTLDAIGAAVSVPGDDPHVLRVVVTDGAVQDAPPGTLVPVAGSVSGTAMVAGELVLIADPGTDIRTRVTAERPGAALGPTVAVPLTRDDIVEGVLTVSRAPGAHPFDDIDLELITAVAAQTSLALHLSRARADEFELQRLTDRESIGDDLREHVISRLFVHGLRLQGAATRTPGPALRTTVEQEVTEVDAIIRDIRDAVFALRPDTRQPNPATAPDRSRATTRDRNGTAHPSG